MAYAKTRSRQSKRIGSRVAFKYPARGKLNILRDVRGVIVSKGKTKKGKNAGNEYWTILEDGDAPEDERTRTFSKFKMLPIDLTA